MQGLCSGAAQNAAAPAQKGGKKKKKMTANCHHMPETQHGLRQADSSAFFLFHWYPTAQS